ncbi:MAG: dihydroorotase [Oscillospiraceae bacterium]
MTLVLIRNGYVIDPSQGMDGIADVMIKDGKIAKIEPNITDRVDRVIEAKGLTVMPGLIDMHVHLRDPGFTHKEDIYTGCNAAITGGITSVLCMPNTKPVIDSADTINYIHLNANRAKAKVYVCASITKGLSGTELCDFEQYKSLDVKAVSDDGRPVESDEIMANAMSEAKKNNLTIISHCEDLQIVAGGIMHKGSMSEKLGVYGIDRLSEDNMTARELYIAMETNTAIHIAHVSTAMSTALIREAKARGADVTAETCPHYFAYTHEKLKSRDADYRMNPPLREQEDVDAIIEGIKDGTFDCIVTDHAPHSKSEKSDFLTAPNGVVGMETSLAASIKFLVEPKHITMYKLVELMSTNPAKILGLNAGSLKVGMPADITILDENMDWTVLPERLQSKSRNCAFKFEKLKGRVKYTFVDGEIVYVMRY